MSRIFLLLVVFFNFSFSIDISKDKNNPIHKEINISYTINNIHEAITSPEKFNNQQYFKRYLRKQDIYKSAWFKFEISNSKNEDIKKRLFTKWDHTNIRMYLVKNGRVIFEEKINSYSEFHVSKPFNIYAEEKLDLYLNVVTNNTIDDFYYLYLTSDEETVDFISDKQRFFHNGLFLGLLLAMMMYNFFMYFSMKMKCYLYLGLHQLMIVFYISKLRYYLIVLFDDFPVFSFWFFKLLFPLFIIFFSILFTKEFLNTKKDMPILDKMLTLSLFVVSYFHLSANYSLNYGDFLYSLFIITGVYSFIKGNKSALFYILGFSPTVLFYIYISGIRHFNLNIYFEYHSVLQVLAVIEAFALSMAIYLKLRETVMESQENEKMLLIQSKFAAMGEMLASIAHQWRQPLNHLDMIIGNIQLAFETKKLDQEYLSKKSLEAHKQLKYMSETIEDFSTFFSSNGKIKKFYLNDVCIYTLELLKSRISKEHVNIEVTIKKDMEHTNCKNELIQVVVIVLNNAIDALMLNNIEDRKISIEIKSKEIIISDNAGGIPSNIINKIFDPYFSTKDKKFGTGLGLYTSKMIIENLLKGKISVKNMDNGASFSILIP